MKPARAAVPPHAVDCCDILRSPLCRTCQAAVFIGAAVLMFAPAWAAWLAWRALPDFESSAALPGLFALATGIEYQPGDDWSFECIKQRCPTESFYCLLDACCRRYVIALSVGVDGSGDFCSHDLAREAACGSSCSSAVLAYSACLESHQGAACTFATGGPPAVVHRGALSGDEMRLIASQYAHASLALAQRGTPGNHIERSFGVGGNTTGHVVTWLTPHIYNHSSLVSHLRRLAHESVRTAGWDVRELDGLGMRCAELLEYGGGGSGSGLGWHWDVGSTLTLVAMLNTSTQAGGELQLSTNCSVFRVPLQRGDVAVYRSRHRHRVTTVSAPRAVLAVEWWRGEQTSLPTRPGKAGKQLLEPADTGSETGAVLPLARSDDALAIGNVGSNENAIDEL